MAWRVSEQAPHCLPGKGELCLFGDHADHKGLPAKYTMDVISYIAGSWHGDPET